MIEFKDFKDSDKKKKQNKTGECRGFVNNKISNKT